MKTHTLTLSVPPAKYNVPVTGPPFLWVCISHFTDPRFTSCDKHTGLFISPPGISELDCATAKTDAAKRSISIGRESLQVFFVLGAATLLEFHVPFTNCFVCRWFCVVHDPKPPLHSHDWLNFGKFQDTERFLIHCERHFSSRLHPGGGTWKYAKAPSTKKKLGEFLYLLICSFLPRLSWLLRSRVRKSRRDLWITLY